MRRNPPHQGRNVAPQPAVPANMIKSPEEIKNLKRIFINTFTNELLSEIVFLRDVFADRTAPRKGYDERIVGGITEILTISLGVASGATFAFPPVSGGLAIAAVGVGVIGKFASEALKSHHAARLKNLSDIFVVGDDRLLEGFFHYIAKSAALRYEHVIATRLSGDPTESVVPLARIGARRIMNFLRDIAVRIKAGEDVNAIYQDCLETQKNESENPQNMGNMRDIFLEGLIQGKSGPLQTSWFKEKLPGNEILKEDKVVLTPELIYGHSAMRRLPVGSGNLSPIYYRETPLHAWQGDRKREKWGATAFNAESKDHDEKIASGPLCGYIFVDDHTLWNYDFQSNEFPQAVRNLPGNEYRPTVYIATRDEVLRYRNHVRDIDLTDPVPTFKEWLIQEVNIQGIDEVWVRAADFSIEADKLFERCKFSGIDFAGCVFDGVHFKHCDMTDSSFAFCSLKGSIWEKIKCPNIDWTAADLTDAAFNSVNYINAILIGTIFGGNFQDQTVGTIEHEIRGLQRKQQDDYDRLLLKIRAERNKIKTQESQLIQQLESMQSEVTDQSNQLLQQRERLAEVYHTASLMQINYMDLKMTLEQEKERVNNELKGLNANQVAIIQRLKKQDEVLAAQLQTIDQLEQKQSKFIEQSWRLLEPMNRSVKELLQGQREQGQVLGEISDDLKRLMHAVSTFLQDFYAAQRMPKAPFPTVSITNTWVSMPPGTKKEHATWLLDAAEGRQLPPSQVMAAIEKKVIEQPQKLDEINTPLYVQPVPQSRQKVNEEHEEQSNEDEHEAQTQVQYNSY